MPAPGYDIAHFYNTATRRGLARNNLYRIKSIGEIFSATDNADLLIYAKDGIVPSRAIDTAKVSFKDFDFVVPTAAKYPENSSWSVNFYCDKSYVLRNLLESWSQTTFEEHQHIQELPFVLCDIDIVLLDNSNIDPNERKLKEIKTYKLVGTFPVNLGALQYSTGNAGEFVTQQVTIAFQYVITEQSETSINTPYTGPLASGIPLVSKRTRTPPAEKLLTTTEKIVDFANKASKVANNLFRGFKR